MRPFEANCPSQWSRRLGVCLAVLGTVGCKDRAHPSESVPVPVTAASSATPTTASATPTTVSARPAASSADAGRQPVDARAREQAAAYFKALGAARRATQARDYERALAAFDVALEARPGDPRAYAERGYAAFLAKKLELARDDLQRAASATSDRPLRAQIFFNLGLVREAQGQDASSAFAISNYLRASAAAQKKLAGKSSCPVEIDGRPEPALETSHAGFLAFVRANQAAVDDFGLPMPKTEAEAHDLACSDLRCQGASPWLIKLASTQLAWVREDAPGLAVLRVASLPSWKQDFCYPTIDAEVVQRSPSFVVFRETGTQYESVMYCGNDGTDHVCQESELGESERPTEFTRACQPHPYTTYRVLDVASKKWTLRVTHWKDLFEGIADSERPQLHVNEKELQIRGAGCDLHFPLSGFTP